MVKTYIGTAKTDANGVATFTYQATGAGKLNLVAESGNLQSDTYPVTDCMFYDVGTSGTPNPKWWYNNSQATFNSTSTGLTISSPSSSNVYLAPNPTGISNPDFNALTIFDNFCIEFTITDRTGNSGSGSSDTVFQLRGLGVSVFQIPITSDKIGKSFKINKSDSNITWEMDSQEQTPYSLSGNVMVRFYIAEGQKSLTFKDFKFYPI